MTRTRAVIHDDCGDWSLERFNANYHVKITIINNEEQYELRQTQRPDVSLETD